MMMNYSTLSSRILIGVLIAFVLIGLFLPLITHAEIVIFGTRIDCEPSEPPTTGGCNIVHFTQVIRAVISFLIRIAIPLAAVFIAWGGIIIMSASGSVDKVAQGKKIITAAIIGLVILLGAWLIVATIYIVLPIAGVGERIRDVLFGNRI